MTSDSPPDRPHPASVDLLVPSRVQTAPRPPIGIIGAAAVGVATGSALLAVLGYLAGWFLQDPGTTFLAGLVATAAVTLLVGARRVWRGGSALPAALTAGLAAVASALCWAQFRSTWWLIGFVVWAAVLGGLTSPAGRAWCRSARPSRNEGPLPRADSRAGRLRIAAAAIGLAVGVLALAGSSRLPNTPSSAMWLTLVPVLLLPVALIAGALRLLHRGSPDLLLVTSTAWAAVSVGLLVNRWELRRFFALEWSDLAVPVLSQVVAPLVAVALLALAGRVREPAAVPGRRRTPGMVVGAAVAAFTFGAHGVLTVLANSASLTSLGTDRTTELLAQVILSVGLTAGAVLLLARRTPWLLVGAAVGGAVLPFVPLTADAAGVNALGLLVPGLMIGMALSAASRNWCLRTD